MRQFGFVVAICFLVITSACSTVRVTEPEATATQQFMTSEAARIAVSQLAFEPLRGRRVYIDISYLDAEHQKFTAAEFRANVLEAGGHVQRSRDEAEIIIELRSAGIGIDLYASLLGIPSITGPPGTADTAGAASQAIVTPEIAITKNIKQIGFASLSYVAYWADTGEIVSSSGPYVGRTYRQDWWILGFGPRTVGNVPVVETEIE